MFVFMIFLVVVSVFGVRKVKIESSMINYFPPDSQLRQDIDYVDDRFAGTNLIFMLVDGPKVTDENGNFLDENGIPVMNKDGKFLEKRAHYDGADILRQHGMDILCPSLV